MVCTFGRGRRMACMARLLDVANFPEKSSEEATHERSALQTMYRQFCDADEPNLLEERDMHVFDSRPLTDPLHLVCCNACGKPVKTSLFAAHAEYCRLINSKEEANLKIDGFPDEKKPPKKGRKRNQAINGREKQESEPVAGVKIVASDLTLDNETGMRHSLSGDIQRMGASVGHGLVPAAAAICSGDKNHSASYMPAPFATKIYRSQGRHRLRAALSHLYQQTSVNQHHSNSLSSQFKQDNTMLFSQVPCTNRSSHEIHEEDVPNTKF